VPFWKDELRELRGKLRGKGAPTTASDGSEHSGATRTEWQIRALHPDTPIPFGHQKPSKANKLPKPSRPSVQNRSTRPTPAQVAEPVAAPRDNPIQSATEPPTALKEQKASTFQPRISRELSLTTPAWIAVGHLLEHPEVTSGPRRASAVRLGIDLGTAFTKVVIKAGERHQPVDWSPVTGNKSPVDRHIMPGLVSRADDGTFGWGHAESAELLGNLKLPVLEETGELACPVATIAFMALVIRYARAWLYTQSEVGRILKDRDLRWELSLGCPTRPHENEHIVARLRRVAQAAWAIAAEPEVREGDIVAAWDLATGDPNFPCDGLVRGPDVVPEFQAQIAGYLASSQARAGLHALIDVGAGTVDVAAFNLVIRDQDEPPNIPIFGCTVLPLGTHYLNSHRHAQFGLDATWDDTCSVEESAAFAARYSLEPRRVDAADDDFARNVAERIFRVLDATRTNYRGDPNSPAWKDGLGVFITGGGARCDVYRRAVKNAEEQIRASIVPPGGFRFIELDPRGGQQTLSQECAGRVSVALGLTEDPESIGWIMPMREVKPIGMSPCDRPDREELWPK
jgi:hypothetical protein